MPIEVGIINQIPVGAQSKSIKEWGDMGGNCEKIEFSFSASANCCFVGMEALGHPIFRFFKRMPKICKT